MCEIGDHNDIREYVTISRGTASTGTTRIGSHNLLMAYTHIGHDCVVGSHCVIANRVSLAGEVHVGDWVVIGGHAAIHQWTHIGEHSMIQGGALLGQDLPPFVIVRNDTLRFAGINKIGLSRRGFTQERIAEIHDACRILFQSGLNYMAACDEVERIVPQSDERNSLVRFIRTSKRGVYRNPTRRGAARSEPPFRGAHAGDLPSGEVPRFVAERRAVRQNFSYKYLYIGFFHYICVVERRSEAERGRKVPFFHSCTRPKTAI